MSEVNDYWILVCSASMSQVPSLVSPHDKAAIHAVRNLIHRLLCLMLTSIEFVMAVTQERLLGAMSVESFSLRKLEGFDFWPEAG